MLPAHSSSRGPAACGRRLPSELLLRGSGHGTGDSDARRGDRSRRIRANQRMGLDSDAALYLLANVLGTAILTGCAAVDHELGFVFVEGVWAVVSTLRLIRALRRARATTLDRREIPVTSAEENKALVEGFVEASNKDRWAQWSNTWARPAPGGSRTRCPSPGRTRNQSSSACSKHCSRPSKLSPR
jgi:hypothetical protein